MKIGRYVEGARNRQQIIDYLISNPGALAPDIIRNLGLDKVAGSDRLAKMCSRGELSRVKAKYCGVNSKGKSFCMWTYAYTAEVTKTVGADEMLKKVAENVHQKPVEKIKKTPKTPKWLTRNTDPDRPPLTNQGGQGAVRQRVYVASCGA